MAGSGIWLDDATYLQTAGQLWGQEQAQRVQAGSTWAQQAMTDAIKPMQDTLGRLQQMVPAIPAAPSTPPPPPAPPPAPAPEVTPAPLPTPTPPPAAIAPTPSGIGTTPVAQPTPAPPPIAPPPPLPMPAPSAAQTNPGENWAQQQIQNLLNPSPAGAQTPSAPSAVPQAIPGLDTVTPPPSAISAPPPTATAGPQPKQPGDLIDQTRQAATAVGIDPDTFSRQINQESGFNPGAQSPAGARGIAQFMPQTAQGLGINPDDPNEALPGAAKLMKSYLDKYGGDWSKALAAYNAGPGNVDKYGGIPPFEETQRYVKTILGDAGAAVQGAAQQGLSAVNTAVEGVHAAVARQSQFGLGLSSGDAMSFCGPTAALAFAQAYGRNPTVAEAKQLAQQVGWDQSQGMAGPQSEVKLLKAMGVDAHMTSGVDWAQVGRDAQGGNPVIIDTPGHYYYVDGYNAQTGQLHVGTSGTDLKGGSEWMTADQINGMPQSHGAARAAIFADHPLAQSDGLAQSIGQAVGQVLGNVPLPMLGSNVNQVSAMLQQNAQTLQQGRDLVGNLLSPDQGVTQPLRAKADGILQAVQNVGSSALQSGQSVLQNALQSAQDTAAQVPQTVSGMLNQNALTAQGIANVGGRMLEGSLSPGYNPPGAIPGLTAGPSGELPGTPGPASALASAVGNLPGLDEASRAARGQAIAASPPGQVYGSDIRQQLLPNITEPGHPMNVRADLQAKYRAASDPAGLGVRERMTPEDQQRWDNATMAIGGMASPVQKELPGMPQAAAQAPGIWDLIHATRIGSLAGGIPTLAHIAFNTPVQTGLKLLRDVPMSVVTGHPEAVPSELYGAMQGMRSWALTAAQTLGQPGPLAERMGGGVGAQTLETGLTGLVRAHPVLQDLARQVAQHMELWRQAATEATNAGMPRFSAQWQEEVSRLVANPTSQMTTALGHAGDTAALGGALGTTGQALADAIKKAPLLRFVLPIFNIGYHVATQGIELSPAGLAGTAFDVARAATRRGGPYAGPEGFAGRGGADAVTPLAERLRNNLIGVGLAFEAYNLAGQGNITGEGPSDPGQRANLMDMGWRPDSIRIGGRYFDAHLLGPVGWSLIQGANAHEATHGPAEGGYQQPVKTPQGERPANALEVLGDLAARQSRYFNNETFLRSAGQVLNVIGSSAAMGRLAPQEAASIFESLIPQGALLANAASFSDPYARQANPPPSGNVAADIGQAVSTRLPGLRQTTPTQLSGTGQPLPNPQQGFGLVLPRSSVINADPILSAMAAAGATPGATPQSVPYGPSAEIRLTPAEQHQYEQYRGQVLQQAASGMVQSAQWRQMPLDAQRAAFQRINAIAADAAGKMVLRDIGPAAQGRMIGTGVLAPVQSYLPVGLNDQYLSQPAVLRSQMQHQALMRSLLAG